MLKYEHIAVGSKIRAYDFDSSGFFIEGIVCGYKTVDGWKALVVHCTADSLFTSSELTRVGTEVYVPMEMSIEFDNRISFVKSWDERMMEERAARFVA